MASPKAFTADNVASGTLTTTVRDAFDNPVPNQNVAVALSGRFLTQSATGGATGANGAFSTTVRTTLAQALSATASVNGGFTLNANLTAAPGPTSQLTVAGIAGGTAAVSSVPQVTAFDAYGNLTPNFVGTVALSSTDPVAVLPAPYAYAPADAGTHVWAGPVTLVTPGVQAVRARMVEAPGVVGSQNNVVVGKPLFASATLTSRALGSSCLDLQGGALAANTPLIARTCTNLASEVFAFGTDGTLRVLGNCVGASGGIVAAGQAVVGAACTGAPAQRWALSGTGQVRSLADPNFCLDLGSAASGTAATVSACGGGAGQQFYIRSVSPCYTLVNGALQQVMEVAGNAIVAGTALKSPTLSATS